MSTEPGLGTIGGPRATHVARSKPRAMNFPSWWSLCCQRVHKWIGRIARALPGNPAVEVYMWLLAPTIVVADVSGATPPSGWRHGRTNWIRGPQDSFFAVEARNWPSAAPDRHAWGNGVNNFAGQAMRKRQPARRLQRRLFRRRKALVPHGVCRCLSPRAALVSRSSGAFSVSCHILYVGRMAYRRPEPAAYRKQKQCWGRQALFAALVSSRGSGWRGHGTPGEVRRLCVRRGTRRYAMPMVRL